MRQIKDYLVAIPVVLALILFLVFFYPVVMVLLLLAVVYLVLRFIWSNNERVVTAILIATLIFVAIQSYYSRQQSISMSKQAKILTEQAELLGNQTQLQQSEYWKRNRPYLRLTGIKVQEGNSSEVLDIVLEIQNVGQVPATKAWLGETWLGEPEGSEVGIYLGAEDLSFNESKGEFIVSNPTGLCMPSLSVETTNVPKSTPVEKSKGTSFNVTITAKPCWLAAINKTGFPEDQIFYPNIPANQSITVNKSSYYEAIRILDTAHVDSMHIGLKYYGEGREYYYIATLQKLPDNTWIMKPIEKGN